MSITSTHDLYPNLASQFEQRIQQTWNSSSVGERRIGPELKFPLVDKNGFAVSRKIVDSLWEFLQKRGWSPRVDAITNTITGASFPGPHNDTIAGCETGYCKIEFSIAHDNSLIQLDKVVQTICSLLAEFSEQHSVYFLGYGIQPRSAPDQSLLIEQTRTSVWDDVCPSNTVLSKEQGGDLALFTVNAGSHVHCSVHPDEAISVVTVLNGFASAILALTANSSICNDILPSGNHCISEQFWDWWIPSQGRSGIPEEMFTSMEHYIRKIFQFAPVYTIRDGEPLLLSRYATMHEYLHTDNPHALTLDGKEIAITPDEFDIAMHNSLYWYCARISKYFTVELRCCDQQPVGEFLTIAALTLGLIENNNAAAEYMNSFSWNDIRKARLEACRSGLSGTVGDSLLLTMAKECLALAREGLLQRKLGEEKYLSPLFTRLEKRQNPSQELLADFPDMDSTSVQEFIARTAIKRSR